MIGICPKMIFNIEKLINIICKPMRIIRLNNCTGTYLHNMCTEEFTLPHLLLLPLFLFCFCIQDWRHTQSSIAIVKQYLDTYRKEIVDTIQPSDFVLLGFIHALKFWIREKGHAFCTDI
jgi:hypothetical protein